MHVLRTLWLASFTLTWLCAEEPQITVSVSSLQVSTGIKALGELGGNLGRSRGIQMELVASCSSGQFVSLDPKACALTKFTDDKGTDLLGHERGHFLFPKRSANYKFINVEVENSDQIPVKGST
jgi:hypothetical protein